MSMLSGILRDLYFVFVLLALWEFIFGHDLLFQPARVALVIITVFVLLAIPYRTLTGDPGRRILLSGGAGAAGVSGGAGGGSLPRLKRTTTSGVIRNLRWCRSEVQGWRPNMEDAACVDEFVTTGFLREWSFLGVFDGHGGDHVSKRLAAELSTHFYKICWEKFGDKYGEGENIVAGDVKIALQTAFARMDDSVKAESAKNCGMLDYVGSTAIVVLISKTHIVAANLGDSRAILCRNGQALSLSEDHKPELPAERRRIEKAGGSVGMVGPCWRVDGWGLNLSRAFGDCHYKSRSDLPPGEQKVSSEPDIRIVALDYSTDTFLCLACDGVFELLSNEDVVDVVKQSLEEKIGENASSASAPALESIVEDLVGRCVSPNLLVTQGKGGDNVSLILAMLPSHEDTSSPPFSSGGGGSGD